MKRPVDMVPRSGVAALAVGVALWLWLFLDPLVTDQSPFLLAGAVISALGDKGKATSRPSQWWYMT